MDDDQSDENNKEIWVKTLDDGTGKFSGRNQPVKYSDNRPGVCGH